MMVAWSRRILAMTVLPGLWLALPATLHAATAEGDIAERSAEVEGGKLHYLTAGLTVRP
jgi:hypothetical protein